MTNETGQRSLSNSLTVDDVQKSIAFFEGLGFGKGETWNDDGGKIAGAELKAGAAAIYVMQDDWKKGRDRQKGVGIHIHTTHDIDQIATLAKASGITLDSEPYDTEWGVRAFEVTEPTGFKITVLHQNK